MVMPAGIVYAFKGQMKSEKELHIYIVLYSAMKQFTETANVYFFSKSNMRNKGSKGQQIYNIYIHFWLS